MCAKNELDLVLPEQMSAVFREACRAVSRAEKRLVPMSEALVIMCRHFAEKRKATLVERNAAAKPESDREGGEP
jgi:hypothetical protein